MNIGAQKAILKVFREGGVEADQSLTRLQLLEGFMKRYPDPDVLDEGIEELISDMQFLEAEDESYGPYTLTPDGYNASLNFD